MGLNTDADRACAAFDQESDRVIKLLTAQEIRDGEVMQKRLRGSDG